MARVHHHFSGRSELRAQASPDLSCENPWLSSVVGREDSGLSSSSCEAAGPTRRLCLVTPPQPNHLPQATPSYCPTGGQDCNTCILGAHGRAVHSTEGQPLVQSKCCPSASVGTPGRQVRNDRGLWGRWRARPGTGIRRARVAAALRCRRVSRGDPPSSLPPPT